MIDKWLDCFSKWETGNQMVFSVVTLIAGLMLVVLSGLWAISVLRMVIDARRGPAPDKTPAPSPDKVVSKKLPLHPKTIIDWAEERRQMEEQHKMEKELQAQAQEEMEQAEYLEELNRNPSLNRQNGPRKAADSTGKDANSNPAD